MPVAVLIDQAEHGDGTRLLTLPHRFVVGPRGEYAHLARQATMYGDRLAVTALCGVNMQHPIVTDDPVGPICGTCIGREQGMLCDGYAYRPRTIRWLPKKWCRSVGYLELDWRTGICLNCGHRGAVRARYGWNASGAQMVQHEHGGRGHYCTEHGRQWLYERDGDLRCSGWKCTGAIRPFWIIGR